MISNKYYAQFGEDIMLNDIFRSKNGNCVEVGGYDGVTGSNTYFFEKLGWHCLIVEPMPEFCEKIRQIRTCDIAELAASDKAGEVEFHIACGVETLSTIEMNDKHLARINSLSDKDIKTITVKTARLDDILVERGMLEIDFLSIDVEGHEMSVLSGMEFDLIRPRIIIIEDNSNGSDNEVRKRLESVAYRRFRRTGCNDWYAEENDEITTWSRIAGTELLIAWRRFRSAVRKIITNRRTPETTCSK